MVCVSGIFELYLKLGEQKGINIYQVENKTRNPVSRNVRIPA